MSETVFRRDGLVDDLNGLGAPFLVAVGPDHDAEGRAIATDIEVFRGHRLLTDGDELRRMLHLHAACRGMPPGRYLGSLLFQRYCHRVCGVAVGAWLRHGVSLDVTAANTSMIFDDGTPVRLLIHRLRAQVDATAPDVVASAVEGHLLPLARVLTSVSGPGMGNLWGNIAAGFAGAFRTLSAIHDADQLRGHAEAIMATRAELERGGSFRTLSGSCGSRLHFDRKSCCHWYAAPDGRYCSWCSRLTEEERTKRFLEGMDD